MGNENNFNTEFHERNKITNKSFLLNRGALLALTSNFLGMGFVVEKNVNSIGRGEDNDIVIKDPAISKEHCRILIDENNRFFLEDLHSKNATYLNGKELKKKTEIFYGDKIVIGETILRFYLEEKLERK
ncbi:MAG TPA: FHA domain-containing protein [Spirochaetota bacterium]|nr:FHA domain-containing protein [Spirochaetota bacterium]